ncbi:MAG: carboxypeptidase M32, partial [Oscillospiraceae bacterium]|nr:carboxypeptidase M32 [Oscillospiraceae bacterium]
EAKELMATLRYLGSAQGVLYCDFWSSLPVKGRPYMQKVNDLLATKENELITSKEMQRLAEYFRELDESAVENDYDRGLMRSVIRTYDHATKVPLDLQLEMSAFSSEASIFWQEAMKNADFKSFKPYLARAFEYGRRQAEAIDPNRNPFDVLVGEADRGLCVEEAEKLFTELRTGIVDILGKVGAQQAAIDTSFLNVDCDKPTKMALARKAVQIMGFDEEIGTFGERIHPVCSGIGPRDCRPTSNYDIVWEGITGLMHECGHGMYDTGANETAIEYSLWGGIGGGMHESQSRFCENLIGKSPEFWEYFYPSVQQAIPSLQKVPLEVFYPAITKATPSLKRMEADELTYNLHTIIRFEMEKEYYYGKTKTDDFEEIWNDKYEKYLGIRPQNAREGVLQDGHWASICIGYFQTYTLGNLYCGQFRHKMLQDRPDAFTHLKNGDASHITGWLRENVHQYGCTYDPQEMLIKATGEPLNAQYFINYLREKYHA